VIAADCRGLRFAYGGAPGPALDGVDLDVRAGEVLLLEGPSGGGKSTLLRALCGLVPHFHGGRFGGRVRVGSLDTMRADPAVVCRAAGMVFQDPEAQAVLGGVARDVAFGLECAAVPAGEIPGRVAEALAGAGALHLRERAIAGLSGGERQRVALASVLAARPAVLLLDEPTSQLDEAAAADLMATLRALAAAGTAVVMAEHRADRARGAADRIVAVRGGRLADAGPPPAPPSPPPPVAAGPVRAVLDGVRAGHEGVAVLDGLDLELRAGEVTTVAGPNGSGKSTLVRVLAGLHRPGAGRVVLDGADVTAVPAERRFPRLGTVGQDPGRHLLTERVRDEVGLALGRRPPRARVDQAMTELGLEALADRHPLELSVGQRERVALAAILVARPGVIVLDEPTRGMDPGAKAGLAALLRRRAADGAAVLVVTHDGAWADGVGDRRMVMAAGRLSAHPRPAVTA
jgi:energy-coupling factor transport system ATP-binding protein